MPYSQYAEYLERFRIVVYLDLKDDVCSGDRTALFRGHHQKDIAEKFVNLMRALHLDTYGRECVGVR